MLHSGLWIVWRSVMVLCPLTAQTSRCCESIYRIRMECSQGRHVAGTRTFVAWTFERVGHCHGSFPSLICIWCMPQHYEVHKCQCWTCESNTDQSGCAVSWKSRWGRVGLLFVKRRVALWVTDTIDRSLLVCATVFFFFWLVINKAFINADSGSSVAVEQLDRITRGDCEKSCFPVQLHRFFVIKIWTQVVLPESTHIWCEAFRVTKMRLHAERNYSISGAFFLNKSWAHDLYIRLHPLVVLFPFDNNLHFST